MTPEERRQHCVTLGKHLVSLGLHEHAAVLRRSFRAIVHGENVGDGWNHAHVVELLRFFDLEPFQGSYVVQPAQAPCPTCSGGMRFTRMAFAGRSLSWCREDRTEWLSIDAPGEFPSQHDAH